MAKKSHTGRRPMPQQAKGAVRKPQAPERAGAATLVRAPEASAPETRETPSAANVVAETAPAAPTRPVTAPAAKPAAAASERKVATAEKPAQPKAAAVSSREQNQRLARARATQRARQANLISAEHYAYVLGDLKLVVALALSAFAILIALTFVLPH